MKILAARAVSHPPQQSIYPQTEKTMTAITEEIRLDTSRVNYSIKGAPDEGAVVD